MRKLRARERRATDSMCSCGFAGEVGFKSSDVRSPCSMVAATCFGEGFGRNSFYFFFSFLFLYFSCVPHPAPAPSIQHRALNLDWHLVYYRDFHGGPVVRNPLYNAGDTGLIPAQGTKIPYTIQQRRSMRHNYWACALESVLRNKRSQSAARRPSAAK